jgi:hypothetical protein
MDVFSNPKSTGLSNHPSHGSKRYKRISISIYLSGSSYINKAWRNQRTDRIETKKRYGSSERGTNTLSDLTCVPPRGASPPVLISKTDA